MGFGKRQSLREHALKMKAENENQEMLLREKKLISELEFNKAQIRRLQTRNIEIEIKLENVLFVFYFCIKFQIGLSFFDTYHTFSIF